MRTPARRHPTLLPLILVSLAAACASNPASRARPAAPVDLNARVAAVEARDEARDIPRGESIRYGRMEDLLAHRFPMLDVQPRGGGRFALAIRGRPALAGAAPLLVVIDGMPFHRGGAEMLASLSPARVRRIEVLKDVAATSSYGRHGANGVIVVTTRRGRD